MSFYERPNIFVGGQWVPSRGSQTAEIVNPATGVRVGSAALGVEADMDAAADAARRSFDSGVWRDLAAGRAVEDHAYRR